MGFSLICLVLSVNLFYAEAVDGKCGGHEVYEECGTKCPRTCANLDNAHYEPPCDSGCAPGCFCEEGYVRHEEIGQCVIPDECPSCPKNQTYKAGGFDCQTCKNHQYVRCYALKEFKCYCYPSYVRKDTSDDCISTQDCPQKRCQDPNEVKDRCYYRFCEKTCQNRGDPTKCPEICLDEGCACKKGYIRDNATRKCVLESECP